MKSLLLFILLMPFFCISQVGINTTTPDDGSALQIDSNIAAFVPPRMDNSQMLAIPTPLDGAVIYNSTFNGLYLRANGSWVPASGGDKPSVILDRGFVVNILEARTNSYRNFPLSTADISFNDTSTFRVETNGSVTILRAGNYLVSGAISTRNLPVGDHKYIIGLFINGGLRGYLNRGFVTVPGGGSDYWGTSGVQSIVVNANDVVQLRYVINNATDVDLNSQFIHFSMMRL